jgi:pimeloyl-ACP methyl ester carboxylesterase
MRGVMDALDVERASVYGGSMGAGTALMLALEDPERIERLVLHAPPPFGRRLTPLRGMFLGLAMLYRLFGSRGTARIVASLPAMRAEQEELQGIDIAGILAAQRREAIVPAIRGLLQEGAPLPAHRFDRIPHQTLVLTHPDDPVHPLASGELLHEQMPHAQLAVAPTRDYWSRNPAGLAHVVASFVLGQPIARGLPGHTHAPKATAATAGAADARA